MKINKNYVLITHRWADVNKILPVRKMFFFWFYAPCLKNDILIFIITVMINIIIAVYMAVIETNQI